MRAPAHDTGHREERRVDLARDADQVVDKARIEVDISAEHLALPLGGIYLLDGDALDALHELELRQATLLDRELARHLLEQDGTRIGLGVDRVADAIHEAALVEDLALDDAAQPLGDLLLVLPVGDVLLEEGDHVADLEVGATVLGTLQGADAGRDGGEGVRAGGGRHTHREGGVVTAAVLGMQDEQQVERAGVQLRIVRSLKHIEEILRQ